MTTRDEIRQWLREAPQGATHMVVVCDTFDYSHFPKYVTPQQDVRTFVEREKHKPMQHVMEVYDLRLDHEDQLRENRAFHY